MKYLLTLAFCFLLVGFSAPTHCVATIQDGNEQDVQAITQEDEPLKAKLIIAGPEMATCGNLVIISVEDSDAKSFKWQVLPATDNFLVIDGGRRVVFSSGTHGIYTFVVACSLGDTVDLGIHTVTMKAISVTPVNLFDSQIALWCDKVKTDEKKAECLALAQSFESVASLMEDGSLKTPVEIVTATSTSNKEALGDSLDGWLPFRDGLSTQLKRMAEDGELSDTASHMKVWRDISIALRGYASRL